MALTDLAAENRLTGVSGSRGTASSAEKLPGRLPLGVPDRPFHHHLSRDGGCTAECPAGFRSDRDVRFVPHMGAMSSASPALLPVAGHRLQVFGHEDPPGHPVCKRTDQGSSHICPPCRRRLPFTAAMVRALSPFCALSIRARPCGTIAVMATGDVSYAQAGDSHIAFRVVGEPGGVDVVMVSAAFLPLRDARRGSSRVALHGWARFHRSARGVRQAWGWLVGPDD